MSEVEGIKKKKERKRPLLPRAQLLHDYDHRHAILPQRSFILYTLYFILYTSSLEVGYEI